jgi:2-oxo-4-hydroxy-4-carboxy-5-ureidoimidazoline decarboxylase
MAAAPKPALPSLPALGEVRTKDALRKAVNALFEPAPPLLERLWRQHERRQFASYEALIDAAQEALAQLSKAERLEVINAHPRIGVKPSQEELSAFSFIEQGLHKESAVTAAHERAQLEATYAELAKLNAEYEARHGFKFVEFVNGRSKAQIVPVLRERLGNPSERELATGLEAMMLIARDRLKKIQAQSRL